MLTAATVPAATLLLFFAGLVDIFHGAWHIKKLAWSALVVWRMGDPLCFWSCCLWAQGYDGIRLFLPGFPFLAVIAGIGADSAGRRLLARIEPRLGAGMESRLRLLTGLAAVLVFVGPFTAVIRLHPCEMAFYNGLAGGLRGAQRLGLETTYWCDCLTPSFLERINERMPEGSTLKALAMPDEVLAHYQERGLLRPDVNFSGSPPYDFHLLQCRQGMFTAVEWQLYRNYRPLEIVEREGVMLYALYGPLRR